MPILRCILLTLALGAGACGGAGDDAIGASAAGDENAVDMGDSSAEEVAKGASDASPSTIVRSQRVHEAATACSQVESGLVSVLTGDNVSALPKLEEGAALAAQTQIQAYIDTADALAAAVVASSIDAVAPTLVQSADALLQQCAADGFERLG